MIPLIQSCSNSQIHADRGLWRRCGGALLFNGTEFQFHQMSVPEMDGSDDFTTMGLHFYLKIFKIYYFCDYIIIHLF